MAGMTIIISITIPAIKPNKKYTGGVRLLGTAAWGQEYVPAN